MNVRLTVKGTQQTYHYSGVVRFDAYADRVLLVFRYAALLHLQRADYGLIELDNEGGIE